MLHSPSSALCYRCKVPSTNTAIIILRDTAVVLRVAVGDVGAATDTGGLEICANVPAHVVIGTTLHVVVADDLTLCIGGVGRTVLRTIAITGL